MPEIHEATERRSFAAEQPWVCCLCGRVEHLNVSRLIHHLPSPAGHIGKKSLAVFAFATSALLS